MKKQKQKKIGFLSYLSKYFWQIFAYVMIAGVLFSVLTLVDVIVCARAIEELTLGIKYGLAEHYRNAVYCFVIALILEIVRRLMIYADFIMESVTNKIIRDMNLDISRQAFRLNSETYSNYGSAVFSRRIIQDPQAMAHSFSSIIYTLNDMIIWAVVIVYLMTLSIYLSLSMFVAFLLVMTIEYFRAKLYTKNYKKVLKQSESISSLANEIIRSEKDIKAVGLDDKLYTEVNEKHSEYRKIKNRYLTVESFMDFARIFVADVSTAAIMILAIVLMDKGLMTIATFMIFYGNMDALYNIPYLVKDLVNSTKDYKISKNRIMSLFDEKNFVTEKFGDVELDKVDGKIEFRNVALTVKEYRLIEENDKKKKKKKSNLNDTNIESKNNEEEKLQKDKKQKNKDIDISVQRELISSRQIFSDLNFVIEPNTTVAFVGKSGSGKSTILDLISKMRVVDKGQVLIDGVNINDLSQNTLRKSITLVNQFPYIFDMTIKENMLLANPNATDDDIYKALQDASMDELIRNLRLGIDTKVGENGVKLSGGQKQRLAIARALLRKTSIIIFDESTSSLDNFAQECIKESIDNLKGKSTIIIVAHRLSTIKNVDKIFFLDNGQIVDSGTFKELLKNNKEFKNMYQVEDK